MRGPNYFEVEEEDALYELISWDLPGRAARRSARRRRVIDAARSRRGK